MHHITHHLICDHLKLESPFLFLLDSHHFIESQQKKQNTKLFFCLLTEFTVVNMVIDNNSQNNVMRCKKQRLVLMKLKEIEIFTYQTTLKLLNVM